MYEGKYETEVGFGIVYGRGEDKKEAAEHAVTGAIQQISANDNLVWTVKDIETGEIFQVDRMEGEVVALPMGTSQPAPGQAEKKKCPVCDIWIDEEGFPGTLEGVAEMMGLEETEVLDRFSSEIFKCGICRTKVFGHFASDYDVRLCKWCGGDLDDEDSYDCCEKPRLVAHALLDASFVVDSKGRVVRRERKHGDNVNTYHNAAREPLASAMGVNRCQTGGL